MHPGLLISLKRNYAVERSCESDWEMFSRPSNTCGMSGNSFSRRWRDALRLPRRKSLQRSKAGRFPNIWDDAEIVLRKTFGVAGTRRKFCAPTRITQRTFKL